MKSLEVLVWNIPALASICFAGYLAANRLDGWGWFLGIGVLLVILPVGATQR